MTRRPLTLACLALALAGVAHAAGGSSAATKKSDDSPEAKATVHYNEALELRDEAWQLERDAGDATPPGVEKLLTRARGKLERAVELDPELHPAWSSLGYVLRRLGDLDGALSAYDRALKLEPSYGEAIEYRAEAYLALGRIDDAQGAYGELAEREPKLASELLVAMRSWIEHRRGTPDARVGELDAFERWVDAREDGRPSDSGIRKSRRW